MSEKLTNIVDIIDDFSKKNNIREGCIVLCPMDRQELLSSMQGGHYLIFIAPNQTALMKDDDNVHYIIFSQSRAIMLRLHHTLNYSYSYMNYRLYTIDQKMSYIRSMEKIDDKLCNNIKDAKGSGVVKTKRKKRKKKVKIQEDATVVVEVIDDL